MDLLALQEPTAVPGLLGLWGLPEQTAWPGQQAPEVIRGRLELRVWTELQALLVRLAPPVRLVLWELPALMEQPVPPDLQERREPRARMA